MGDLETDVFKGDLFAEYLWSSIKIGNQLIFIVSVKKAHVKHCTQ